MSTIVRNVLIGLAIGSSSSILGVSASGSEQKCPAGVYQFELYPEQPVAFHFPETKHDEKANAQELNAPKMKIEAAKGKIAVNGVLIVVSPEMMNGLSNGFICKYDEDTKGEARFEPVFTLQEWKAAARVLTIGDQKIAADTDKIVKLPVPTTKTLVKGTRGADDDDDDDGFNWKLLLIIMGIVVAIILLVTIPLVVICRKNQKKNQNQKNGGHGGNSSGNQPRRINLASHRPHGIIKNVRYSITDTSDEDSEDSPYYDTTDTDTDLETATSH